MSQFVRDATFGEAELKKHPGIRTGDTVAVYSKIKEGNKERVQKFQGVVIKIQGCGMGKSFTVRKISSGVGVEKTFPELSPMLDRIEIQSRSKVRRKKLFFLRGLKGRAAKLTATQNRGSHQSEK